MNTVHSNKSVTAVEELGQLIVPDVLDTTEGYGHIANKVVVDMDRAASAATKKAYPARERGIVVNPLVAAFHEAFKSSVELPARRDDEQRTRSQGQKTQASYCEMLGMSAEDIRSIEASAQSEASAEQPEGQRDVDPDYINRRTRLARAFVMSSEQSEDYPKELAKLALARRIKANKLATMRVTDLSRTANEDLKVLFSVFNSAARSVVFAAGRAIASTQFHDDSYHEDFHHENKVYSIDKVAGDLPAEGLFSDDNPFFGYHVDEILASFEHWKDAISAFYMAIVGIREDLRYTTHVRLITPGDFDALEFGEMRSTKDRSYTELEYRNFSVESVVEEELMKLKLGFAVEAKAAEYLGATDGHASSIDF